MSLELHGQHRKCQDVHHTQTSAAINKFTDFYSFRSQKEKKYPDRETIYCTIRYLTEMCLKFLHVCFSIVLGNISLFIHVLAM